MSPILGIVASSKPVFSPLSIANLKGWYDASDTGTITVSGTAVTQWNDKSGNSKNLTQGPGANRPLSGVRTQNGKNAIEFDGSNDFLIASTASDWVFLSNTSTATVFIVAFADTAADLRFLMSTDGGTAASTGSYMAVQSNDLMSIASFPRVGSVFPMVVATGTPTFTDNTAAIFTAQYDLGNATIANRGYIWKNGASQTNNNTENATASSGNPSNPLTIGKVNDGGSEGWDGLICEVILYNALLNATDRGKIETYLTTKWGI